MSPAPGLAWTTGQRLLVSNDADPRREISSWTPTTPLLKLYFQGHLHFMSRASPIERSRNYRAAILECMDATDQTSQEARFLQEAHCVWSFVQAVYLVNAVEDSTHVSCRLSEWYMINFPDIKEKARVYVDEQIEPENSKEEDDFWNLVARLVAVGARKLASQMIAFRISRKNSGTDWASAVGAAALRVEEPSADAHSPLAVAEALLAECPANVDSSLAGRLDGAWTKWQHMCNAWADELPHSEENHLVRVLKVMAGNMRYIAAACASWEEMLVASLLYSPRTLSGHVSDSCILDVESACAEASTVFELPRMLAGGALIEAASGRPAEAIVRLGASTGSTWFAAHLCDVLMQAGRIPMDGAGTWMENGADESLLEYMILEFARDLEQVHGMWRIVADYYAQCPMNGRKRLSEMLLRVPASGPVDPTIEKVVRFCETQNLRDVKQKICARSGGECERVGNFAGAMFWFARGDLSKKIDHLVEASIAQAEVHGPCSFSARVVTKNLGVISNLVMERLAFVRDYAAFQSAVSAVANAESSRSPSLLHVLAEIERLCSRLLRGGGLPRRFWPVVIYDFCSIFEGCPDYARHFTTDVLYDVLSALEYVTTTGRYNKGFENFRTRVLSKNGGLPPRDAAGRAMKGNADAVVEKTFKEMERLLLTALSASFCKCLA